MQNIEQESHSKTKLAVVLAWLFLLLSISVLSGSGNDVKINPDNKTMVTFLYIMQILLVIIFFILPSLLFSIFWTKQRIHYIGITTKPALSTLLLGGIGILMAMPMINWLAELNQHMQLPESLRGIETWMKNSEAKAAAMTEIFTRGTSIGKLLLNLFVIAFMAALSEEIFFRGVLQKVLIETTRNKHIGIWIAAALFSSFHMQFFGFVPRMLMGAYLGYLFLWSGSLWPGMIAHFLNNGTQVFLLWLMNRGKISSDADKIGIEQGQWTYVFTSFVIVSISLFLVYRIEKKRNNSIIKVDPV